MSSSIEKAILRLRKVKEKHGTASNGLDADSAVTQEATELQAPVLAEKRAEKKVDGNRKNQVNLDYDALHALGFITPKHRDENLEEQYRILKRPILMNAFGKGAAPVPGGNLVMVTSAMPGEGKSFTAMNLAISMAKELDSTVLLVDGDTIRASLSKILNVHEKIGLTDLLEEKVQGLEEVILSTDNPKLKIIPAGLRN